MVKSVYRQWNYHRRLPVHLGDSIGSRVQDPKSIYNCACWRIRMYNTIFRCSRREKLKVTILDAGFICCCIHIVGLSRIIFNRRKFFEPGIVFFFWLLLMKILVYNLQEFRNCRTAYLATHMMTWIFFRLNMANEYFYPSVENSSKMCGEIINSLNSLHSPNFFLYLLLLEGWKFRIFSPNIACLQLVSKKVRRSIIFGLTGHPPLNFLLPCRCDASWNFCVLRYSKIEVFKVHPFSLFWIIILLISTIRWLVWIAEVNKKKIHV